MPIFLIGDATKFDLYEIPINLLLKDNADDIRDKVLHFSRHDVIGEIKQEAQKITYKYASQNVIFEPRHIPLENLKNEVETVFIALHGRPGEDGHVGGPEMGHEQAGKGEQCEAERLAVRFEKDQEA